MSTLTRRSAPGRYVTCECGKRGYDTKQAAKVAIRRVDPTMHTYKCPTSGRWHIGHYNGQYTRRSYR